MTHRAATLVAGTVRYGAAAIVLLVGVTLMLPQMSRGVFHEPLVRLAGTWDSVHAGVSFTSDMWPEPTGWLAENTSWLWMDISDAMLAIAGDASARRVATDRLVFRDFGHRICGTLFGLEDISNGDPAECRTLVLAVDAPSVWLCRTPEGEEWLLEEHRVCHYDGSHFDVAYNRTMFALAQERGRLKTFTLEHLTIQ